MTTNPDALEDAYVYEWEGDPQGHNWLPNSLTLAAESDYWTAGLSMCSRQERDWALRVYSAWVNGGRRRYKDGTPERWWRIADEEDPMTRRALSEMREARTAAVDDRGDLKRPPMAPTGVPAEPAAPDSPAEAGASRWSRALGMGRHRATRRSQTAEGVRDRRARAKARAADLARKDS